MRNQDLAKYSLNLDMLWCPRCYTRKGARPEEYSAKPGDMHQALRWVVVHDSKYHAKDKNDGNARNRSDSLLH